MLPLVGGLVAIVTGHLARNEISRTGERGNGFATIGLVLGYLNLAFLLLILAVFLFVFFGFDRATLVTP